MSSIVTSILSLTVGLLVNKARDSMAAKLKDGDVTDARVRELIVRDMNDVKTKLDGLSRKDLLSSYRFLQEGVDLLNVSFGESKPEQKAVVKYGTRDDLGEASGALPSGVESLILNDVSKLSLAIEELKIESNKEFEAANERFKDSRKRATDAFCIESLSIGDKIFAAKLRVISELLEGLERSETAIIGCLSFLKELHSLPAIQETFLVYLNGGIKSLVNKTKRVENVKSIMLINYVLYQYVLKFSTKDSSVLTWPEIELADRRFNPMLQWQEVASRKSMGGELPENPNALFLCEDTCPRISAVNSHGDVVLRDGDNLKFFCRKGESKLVKLPKPREVVKQYIRGIAVDKNDNIYVHAYPRTITEEKGEVRSNVLYMMDINNNYNIKYDSTIEFLKDDNFFIHLAVNSNNDIIIMVDDQPHLYIYDNTGQLKQKFETFTSPPSNLGISEQNEIIVSDHNNHIRMYTEEGNLKSTIQVQKSHKVFGAAFHSAICKIVVLTLVKKEGCCYLLWFSETGELERKLFLFKLDKEESIPYYYPQIRSSPKGPIAVIRRRSIHFIP